MIKKSHQLFLWIQKNITNIPIVRFIIKFFDKKLDILLGFFVALWVLSHVETTPWSVFGKAVFGFLILFIITTIIKYTVHEPRPFVTYGDIYDSPNHFGRNDSFPSNHTVYFFGLATVVSLLFGYIIWPLYIVAIFIGITRIIGGVHYPHDVLAGMLFGTIGVLFFNYFLGYLFNLM